MTNQRIREKLPTVPEGPGVYLMKSKAGHLIYVGKAKNLRNRVRSYFNESQKGIKTASLVQEITDFDIIMTHNEKEALLFERSLIKHHKPKYNILLKDDKDFPFIRVDLKEEWPRIEKVRRKTDDGASYYGPFTGTNQLNLVLRQMGKIFPLIRCSRHEFQNVTRPCTYYHIKMCLGPCHIKVSRERYLEMVHDALEFLQGRSSHLRKNLEQRMQQAAEAENFELAADYRDLLRAVQTLAETQYVDVHHIAEADYIGTNSCKEHICFHVMNVREHKLVGGENFICGNYDSLENQLTSFLMQYYQNRPLPGILMLPAHLEYQTEIEEALLEEQGKACQLRRAIQKKDLQLIEMAAKNAEHALTANDQWTLNRHRELEAVGKLLGLETPPKRIECIDISNFLETAIVGGLVCFIEGEPVKRHYRTYNISFSEKAPNDFEAIREVVTRRLTAGAEKQDLPDVLLIDGGKGQLAAARKAARALDIGSAPTIVSIAKSRTKGNFNDRSIPKTPERIYLQDDLYVSLVPGSPEFSLCTRLRDEAHRFVIGFHRKQRKSKAMLSKLDDVHGLGPKKKTALLQHFGTVTKVFQATEEELTNIPGITKALAARIKNHHRHPTDPD